MDSLSLSIYIYFLFFRDTRDGDGDEVRDEILASVPMFDTATVVTWARSKIVHVLAFGTPKFYIAPYDKINRGLVNLSYNRTLRKMKFVHQ